MSKLMKSLKSNSKRFEYQASRVPALIIFGIIIFTPSFFLFSIDGISYIEAKLSSQESQAYNIKSNKDVKSATLINSLEFFIISILFFLCGLMIFIFLSRYSFFFCVIDLDQKCLKITSKWLFREIDAKEYSLDNITEIHLEKYDDGAEPRAFIRLKTEDKILIPTGMQSAEMMASDLQEILQIPVKILNVN